MRIAPGFVAWLAAIAAAPAAERPVDFERDIRPLLTQRCVSCHGEKKQKAGLRLDRRPDAAFDRLMTPGKSDRSPLVHRIAGTEPDARMPPDGPPLSPDHVKTIRTWIDQGARWPMAEEGHWSLRRMSAPRVPDHGVSHPVDAFIRASLDRKGLTPSPPADRRTLIRRLTYNLHGLPPTPEEINAFLNDSSPDAYDRLVDRLLANPRYGERWARHWMDVAHFAETHGHDQDAIREHAWPYRDYLIRAMNLDKPYARFVREQIAGDLQPASDPSAIAALGFLAAGPWDESSQKDIRDDTVDKKQAQYLDRDDVITTVFTAMTSTSIHCARCHDHKFDPISQKEYYGLQAIFAGVERANRSYDPDPEVARNRAELTRQKGEILAGRFDEMAGRSAVADWEKEVSAHRSHWKSAAWKVTAKASTIEPQADDSFAFTGPRPDKDTYSFTAIAADRISAVRLEVLADPSLPHKGPGRQDNGNLHLSEVRVRTGDSSGNSVPIRSAVADFNQMGWDISRAIDGNPTTAWGIYPAVGKSHAAVFQLKDPVAAGTRITVDLDQLHGAGHLIGRVRLTTTDVAKPALDLGTIPSNIESLLATPKNQRTPQQWTELTRHVLVHRLDAQLAALPKPQLVYVGTSDFDPVGSFKPPRGPRPIHLLKRGEVTKPGELVDPAVPAMVTGPRPLRIQNPANEGSRRAALADWLTDPENGLVWRSIVNRVWHHHFGRGIVATPNDFGRMGAAPTHPELLDWLAVWFRDSGGSLKSLHRLILRSETYRQSSADRPEFARIDSDNAYLWRMNRSRLDAESVRDAMLATSGTLNQAMGGPSARHFQLAAGVHVTPVVEYLKFDVETPAARRRSVYRFIFRTLPDPFFEALDCPDASQFTPVRAASVTALQALALMNDRFAVRYAEHFAARLERSAPDLPSRITLGYELALGRPPSAAEVARLTEHAGRHGLANACRLLFNCNEFLFVD